MARAVSSAHCGACGACRSALPSALRISPSSVLTAHGGATQALQHQLSRPVNRWGWPLLSNSGAPRWVQAKTLAESLRPTP
eukprot:3926807-Alexandrium_andersonii.AAC.1